MLESVLPIPFWIELAGALTGGLAGGMAAVRARYDVFGTVVIAIVAGLGGGIMRDVLLQDYGIYAFQHPALILACAGAGLLVFFFHKLADVFDWLMDFLDNLSVGLWAVVSVGKGLSAGVGIIPSIILGTITAVGGGVMRDVLMARPPVTFQAGTLYGLASLLGSTAYALMDQHDVLGDYAAITCVGLVFVLRYASEFFGWRTKPAEDYSDRVIEPVRKVAHVAARPMHKVIDPVREAVVDPVKDAVVDPVKEAARRARHAEGLQKEHLANKPDRPDDARAEYEADMTHASSDAREPGDSNSSSTHA